MILRQSETVLAQKKSTVARVEQFQLLRRDPDGREPIAGARFLSCCDLGIFYLRIADRLWAQEVHLRPA